MLGTGEPRASKGPSTWPPPSSVCWLKMVPSGFVVPALLGMEKMSPRGTVLSVTCVPVGLWLGCVGVSDRQQLSECLSPPQDSVRSARAGMRLQHVLVSVPKTISQEYGSGQYFLRGLSREMQHTAAGPGELCSLCEPQSCKDLWQAQGRCCSENFDEAERRSKD